MSNVKLLNQFVRIFFMKTHSQDSIAVDKTMEVVASWMLKTHRSGNLIPPDFDFAFFFQGVNLLLELDHGNSTAKVVWMLY